MKLSMISFTRKGALTSVNLYNKLIERGYECSNYAMEKYCDSKSLIPLKETLKKWTEREFKSSEGLIFIGACGMAVRAFAPFITIKTKDPAVIVIDELGKYAISVLSGHIGGANELAEAIGEMIGAEPVITTATDINNKFSVDVFAKKNNLFIFSMLIAKDISAAVLEDEEIGFSSDVSFNGELPCYLSSKGDCRYGIRISLNDRQKPFERTLNLIPRTITIGLGCRKGKSFKEIESFILDKLKDMNISIHSVVRVASIDVKKNEEGLLEFCDKYHIEKVFYTSEELDNIEGEFTKSDFVKKVVKVDNVCERAAVLGSGYGELLLKKYAKNGITMAIADKKGRINFE